MNNKFTIITASYNVEKWIRKNGTGQHHQT